jgi:hypothetical protein
VVISLIGSSRNHVRQTMVPMVTPAVCSWAGRVLAMTRAGAITRFSLQFQRERRPSLERGVNEDWEENEFGKPRATSDQRH